MVDSYETIDAESKKILNILAGIEEPVSGKEISAVSGLEAGVVNKKIKVLKSKGLPKKS